MIKDFFKKYFKNDYARLFLSFAIIAVIAVVMITNRVSVRLDDGILKASSLFFRASVAVDEIEEIQLLKNVNVGKRSMGADTFFTRSGDFDNSEFGRYKLCAARYAESYIYISYPAGVLVVSCADDGETEALYTKILSEFE